MVYVRTKSVGGEKYSYIVKSVWDPDRRGPRQKIVKYLGKSSEISAVDIPSEYAGEPKVREFMDTLTGRSPGPGRALDRIADELLEAMLSGDTDAALRIRGECESSHGIIAFYDRALKPAMYRVGEMWMDGSIKVGDEHVASNVASMLVRPAKPRRRSGSVIICTPVGEEHSIGCAILEAALSESGLSVCNMAPSAPASEVAKFVQEHRPDLVLVSVTAEDNVAAARRLIGKIAGMGCGVMAGGQGAAGRADLGCRAMAEQPLEQTVREVRAAVAEQKRQVLNPAPARRAR